MTGSLRCLLAMSTLVGVSVSQVTFGNATPREFAVGQFSTRSYFVASPDRAEATLYTTDGSSGGAMLLRGFPYGPGFEGPADLTFVLLQNRLLFTADSNAGFGRELWVSSGTGATTAMLKDIAPGLVGSRPRDLTVLGREVYFTADNGVLGRELWASNGTPAGTRQVADPRPGSGSSEPRWLTAVGSVLAFTADNGISGRELWTHDPATGVTKQVADIRPGPLGSTPTALFAQSAGVTAAGGVLFSASDGVSGFELWHSDLTAAGTNLVADIHPAGSSSPHGFAQGWFGIAFVADDGARGAELWLTDGTAAGTRLLHDINPAPGVGSNPSNLLGGVFLSFVADDGTHGFELWTSNGTTANLVSDIANTPSPSADSFPNQLVRMGLDILFTADDGVSGRELWRSDGITASLVKDIKPGRCKSRISSLTGPRGFVPYAMFSAETDDDAGLELWRSDGTMLGTVRIEDLYAPSPEPDQAALDAQSRRHPAMPADLEISFKLSAAALSRPAAILVGLMPTPGIQLPFAIGALEVGPVVGSVALMTDAAGEASVSLFYPAVAPEVRFAAQAVVLNSLTTVEFSNNTSKCVATADLSSCPDCAGWSILLEDCSFLDDNFEYCLFLDATQSSSASPAMVQVVKVSGNGTEEELLFESPLKAGRNQFRGTKTMDDGDYLSVRLSCGDPATTFCELCRIGC